MKVFFARQPHVASAILRVTITALDFQNGPPDFRLCAHLLQFIYEESTNQSVRGLNFDGLPASM